MKKILFLSVFVLILTALIPFFPAASDFELYDNVIRLHILANSDSDADQALKLYVRDEILSTVDGIVGDAKNKNEAEAAIRDSLDIITAAAADAVREYGSDTSVSVSLSTEKYPRRTYGTFALPSGNYTSLRIMLGCAEGQNWWCVLFPRLCTAPAVKDDTETKEEFIEVGFTPSQYKIISGKDDNKYKIKFRILEIFEELFS